MLSTVSIISMFFQIFTSGISFAGGYSFMVRYLEKRKKDDQYLSLIFMSFALFTALTIGSQIMYMMGMPDNIRFIIYRLISADLVAGALFIAYFIKEKFGYRENLLYQLLLLASVVEVFLIIKSPLNLIENIKGIAIDPGAHFLTAIPPEIFWVVLWLILGIRFLLSARASKERGEKNIYALSGFSAILVVMSFFLLSITRRAGKHICWRCPGSCTSAPPSDFCWAT